MTKSDQNFVFLCKIFVRGDGNQLFVERNLYKDRPKKLAKNVINSELSSRLASFATLIMLRFLNAINKSEQANIA